MDIHRSFKLARKSCSSSSSIIYSFNSYFILLYGKEGAIMLFIISLSYLYNMNLELELTRAQMNRLGFFN